jgi:phospholipase/carboxylesterase
MLALHGTGGDERDLLPLVERIAPGAPVLAPRGNVIERDGMPRFFRRVPVDPASGLAPAAYPFVFDEADVAARTAELAAFAEVARVRYRVSDRMLVAVGFSNGANIGAALLLLRPGLLDAAVLFAPMPVLSEPPRARLDDTAVFLGGGRGDPIATPEHVERLASTLTDAGAAVEVHIGEGGHEIRLPVVRAATDWFTKLRSATATEPGGLP